MEDLLRAVYVDEPGEATPVCVNVALVTAGLAMVYIARDDAVEGRLVGREREPREYRIR